jgi:hypothetical protein
MGACYSDRTSSEQLTIQDAPTVQKTTSAKAVLASEHFPKISLDAILDKNASAVQTLQEQLAEKGWAVVILPKRITLLTAQLYPKLWQFFQGKEKNKWFDLVSSYQSSYLSNSHI